MAENPTSSSTTYTTFGAPSGALGGSNGVQSGTESRISTLIVPLNGSLIALLLAPRRAFDWSHHRGDLPGRCCRLQPGRPTSSCWQRSFSRASPLKDEQSAERHQGPGVLAGVRAGA